MSPPSSQRRRAIFLDKDGTLVEDVPYNADPAKIRFAPGAADAIRSLSSAGFRLFVITNQSGVARGMFPISALAAIQSRVETMMQEAGAPLDGFYFCPHLPDGSVAEFAQRCDCRKPAPGLILQAAAEHDIDLPESWVVGDKLDDVEAGRQAGCRTVLIGSSAKNDPNCATAVVADLASAARVILSFCGDGVAKSQH
jgi:D,D-heptose 1,7-bisphosphate phosphatase